MKVYAIPSPMLRHLDMHAQHDADACMICGGKLAKHKQEQCCTHCGTLCKLCTTKTGESQPG